MRSVKKTRRDMMPRLRRRRRCAKIGVLVGAVAAIAGCSSIRVTDPPRTATEQFLLSRAATEAVLQLAFNPLRGRKVFVDAQYFAASEQAFVLGELRAQLLLAGVQLVPAADAAEIILEVRSSGVGIDRSDFLLGLPPILLSADTASSSLGDFPIVTPELAIVKNIFQEGIASVAYVAYWRETGEVVASSGPYVGRTFREDWWFFGFGPRTLGDIPPAERPTE